VDPVLTAAHVIVALQSVVSRNVHSREQAVLSVTMVHGGEVSNVIPDTVTLQGTMRDLKEEVFETIISRTRAIVNGVCAAFGATANCTFNSMYCVLNNHEEQAGIVADLARTLLGGPQSVTAEGLPNLGAEDFAFFLQKVPGCFFFLGGKEPALTAWSRVGSSAESRSNCMCHSTAFDYNDNVSPLAAVFFVRLVEHRLGTSLYTKAELPMPLPPTEEADGDGDSVSAKPAGPIILPTAKKARTS